MTILIIFCGGFLKQWKTELNETERHKMKSHLL